MPSFNQLMTSATAHHKEGRLDEAARFYAEALKLKPGQGDALRLLGTLYLQTNRYDLARDTLLKALKAQPRNVEILNNLGIVARNTGDMAGGIKYFRQALGLQADYAEALNNLGSALQVQGELTEAIDCYRQAVAAKPDYALALRNLGRALREAGRDAEALAPLQQALALTPDDPHLLADTALILHHGGEPEQAADLYDRALALQPQFYAALVNSGSVLRNLRRPREGLERLNRALQLKPDSVEALINMAAIYWDVNRLDLAVKAYSEALRLQPDHVAAIIHFGVVLTAAGRVEEAVAHYHKALRLAPGHPEALTNLGALQQEQGKLDEALAFYEKALIFTPGFRGALWRKGMLLLAQGDYLEGWRLYETGLREPQLRGYGLFRAKPWDGKPLPEGRLLIWSEQGLGDSLQFVRYAALCKRLAGKVIVQCPKPLLRLYRNSPFIDAVVTEATEADFDAQASLMSLPHLCGTTLDTVPATIPYLAVAPEVQKQWDEKFTGAGGPKVGLVWAGSAREGQVNANLTDRRRSMSLENFRSLFAIEGAHFYNLQMGPPAAQMKECDLGARLTDYMGGVGDFMDTAALINNLDLVITVDTSVAHLAGALGKPVWILSRYDACWRWLQNRPDSPWYPTARVFGQKTPGDWPPVVEAVREALAVFAAAESPAKNGLSLSGFSG